MSARRGQRGFSLVAAIFLLVVLAALGAFAVRLTVFQSQTVTSALRAAQAYQAARSGAAWAAYRAVNDGVCPPATLALTEGGTAGFNVSVSCTQLTYVEGTAPPANVFVLSVRATAGAFGSADYVSRQLQTKVN
ncbi:MAG TPA: pilus assembly protein MshP [Gammaproteobacteria bacterium]|nr:pilus assembly protein MshP [Gammaproteobacteria bacterium]